MARHPLQGRNVHPVAPPRKFARSAGCDAAGRIHAHLLAERLRVGVSRLRERGYLRGTPRAKRHPGPRRHRRRGHERPPAGAVAAIRTAALPPRDRHDALNGANDRARPIRHEPLEGRTLDSRCRSRSRLFRPAAPDQVAEASDRSDPGRHRAREEAVVVLIQDAPAPESYDAKLCNGPERTRFRQRVCGRDVSSWVSSQLSWPSTASSRC